MSLTDKNKVLQYVKDVFQTSPFYKGLAQQQGINIQEINSLEAFKKLPFTTKDHIAKNNTDFLRIPLQDVKEFVTTSGSMGNPIAVYLSKKDLERLAVNEQKAMCVSGANSTDVFQLMVTLDKLFMAGIAYYLGIQKLGAATIRTGPGAPLNQLECIHKFGSTVLVAIPSFIISLINTAQEKGIDLAKTNVHSIVCIGEAIRNDDFTLNNLGQQIKDAWDVNLLSTYASTEMASAFTECPLGNGGHCNSELVHLECIDENGNEVADGEIGEVVVTPLQVEAFPLIRYKTGDLCRIHYKTCACGSKEPRLGPVIGRKQQMIKYKGTTLFPAAIFDVLAAEKVKLYQVVVSKNNLGNDNVRISLPTLFENSLEIKSLKAAFKAKLRVTPDFTFISDELLQKQVYSAENRKATKVVFTTA